MAIQNRDFIWGVEFNWNNNHSLLQNCFFITVSLPSKDDICQSVSILHFYLSFIFIIIFTHVNGAGWDVNLLTFLQLS